MNASEKSNTLIGIMIVAVSMIGLIIFFTRVGFDLTPVEDVHLEKVVTVEGYANSFCDSYVGNNNELNKECSNLTKKNCLSTSCCVYSKMNGKEGCFSGNEHARVVSLLSQVVEEVLCMQSLSSTLCRCGEKKKSNKSVSYKLWSNAARAVGLKATKKKAAPKQWA